MSLETASHQEEEEEEVSFLDVSQSRDSRFSYLPIYISYSIYFLWVELNEMDGCGTLQGCKRGILISALWLYEPILEKTGERNRQTEEQRLRNFGEIMNLGNLQLFCVYAAHYNAQSFWCI